MTLLSLETLYVLLGLLLAAIALLSWRDRSNPRRWSTGLFWALYALLYLAGARLPPTAAGALMVLMALLAGLGGVRLGTYGTLSALQRKASALKLGHWLLVPALLIPALTLAASLLLKHVKVGGWFLLEQTNVTLGAVGLACLVSLAVACRVTRATPLQAVREARRLADAMGWAVVLPHMLAVLGLLFAQAGVGKAVAALATTYIAMDLRLVAVLVYCVGMALFTVITGNGFAAFPVMTAGVGVPVLVGVYHANPALMAAIGMFSGYCGTLMTPMAANFNSVPVVLLELPDQYAVIKAQLPTALVLLAVNIILLYFLMNH